MRNTAKRLRPIAQGCRGSGYPGAMHHPRGIPNPERVPAARGDRVESGQPLATLEIGERPVDVENVSRRVGSAFEITDAAIEVPRLVLGPVDEVDPSAWRKAKEGTRSPFLNFLPLTSISFRK